MSDEIAVVENPFGESAARPPATLTAMAEAAAEREVAEVQAGVIMARKFPRDRIAATDAILQDCTRLSLAQAAVYNYSRGGTEITGPSIRLAESLAQNWGNISFGIKEVVRGERQSEMEAFAYDLQTNLKVRRGFIVKHERYSRTGGRQALTGDVERDVNEITSNQGARRLRACILAVIPGDVVEAAVTQCETTLLAKADTSPEAVGKLVTAFEQFGVTREQIETRIQRRLDTIRPAQIVQLRKTWASLNDGMSVATDWFPKPQPEGGEPAAPEAKGNEGLKAKLRPTARAASAPAADQAPGEAAPPASEPGTAAGTSATGDATSGERPQSGAHTAGLATPTPGSATAASPPSPGQEASGQPPPAKPSSAGELPLREPGEEG
jgi:hypothetical protein